MHVLLLGAHPSRGHGARRLTRLLERAWRENGVDVTVLTAPDTLSRHVRWEAAGRGLAALESATGLGRRLRQVAGTVDLVHVVDPRDALWTASLPASVPVTVTCHDVASLTGGTGRPVGDPAVRRPATVDRLRGQLVLKAVQRVDHIMSTSHATAEAVLEVTGQVSPVLHPPIDPAFDAVAGRPGRSHLGPAWPYLLTVAGTHRGDRRAATIASWANLRRTRALDGASLVVVGAPLTPAEEGLVAACGGHVEVVTDVSDAVLGTLYAGAEAVLSLGEPRGFSWPVAEAHNAGRPVLATDCASLQEVGADGCVYLPVEHIESFDAVTWSAIADDLTSPVLAVRAQANAARFAWADFVDNLGAAALPVEGRTDPVHTAAAPVVRTLPPATSPAVVPPAASAVRSAAPVVRFPAAAASRSGAPGLPEQAHPAEPLVPAPVVQHAPPTVLRSWTPPTERAWAGADDVLPAGPPDTVPTLFPATLPDILPAPAGSRDDDGPAADVTPIFVWTEASVLAATDDPLQRGIHVRVPDPREGLAPAQPHETASTDVRPADAFRLTPQTLPGAPTLVDVTALDLVMDLARGPAAQDGGPSGAHAATDEETTARLIDEAFAAVRSRHERVRG